MSTQALPINDIINSYNSSPPEISDIYDLAHIKSSMKNSLDEFAHKHRNEKIMNDSVDKTLHTLILKIRELLVNVDVLGWKKSNRKELVRQIDCVLENIVGL